MRQNHLHSKSVSPIDNNESWQSPKNTLDSDSLRKVEFYSGGNFEKNN